MSYTTFPGAACAELEPAVVDRLFFASKPTRADFTGALKVCADCPVRVRCLLDAIRTDLEDLEDDKLGRLDVRGGIDPHQRRRAVAILAKGTGRCR